VGEDGAEGSRTGQETATSEHAPAATSAAAIRRHAAAHRCQPTCLVRRRTVLRLITIMDDTSEIYYARLVDEEGTRKLMRDTQVRRRRTNSSRQYRSGGAVKVYPGPSVSVISALMPYFVSL
jgi:hypothetical protein